MSALGMFGGSPCSGDDSWGLSGWTLTEAADNVRRSCGIPDFRSPTGLYATLRVEHPELDDPQEMFDLAYFKEK